MQEKTLPAKEGVIRTKVIEFIIPPVRDALVLGKRSPIGCVAMKKALALLSANRFEDIGLQDDIISNVLVRENLLLKIPREKFISFILRNVKPLMNDHEILHLDVQVELVLEEQI